MDLPLSTPSVDIKKLIIKWLQDEDLINAPAFRFEVSKDPIKFNLSLLTKKNLILNDFLDLRINVLPTMDQN